MEFISAVINENGRVSCYAIDNDINNGIKIDIENIEQSEYLKQYINAYKLVDGILTFSNEEKETIDEENKMRELRKKRKPLLQAFDIWSSNVAVDIETSSEEIKAWRLQVLDLNEDAMNMPPQKIMYYLYSREG